MKRQLTIGTGIVATLALALSAQATTVDLTGGVGSSGEINGAFFEFAEIQPAGTGVIDPFVRIQKNGPNVVEDGYNTSARPIPEEFDVKVDPNFTRDIQFGDISVVTDDSAEFLAFYIDINEPSGSNAAGRQFLSLNELQIYTNESGNQSPTDVSALGTLHYDLDGAEDSEVLMDATQSSGSGSSDVNFFIPLSLFDGVDDDDFFYLYALFGATEGFEGHGGFEEIGTFESDGTTVIPAPAAAGLGIGMLGLIALRRRRRN